MADKRMTIREKFTAQLIQVLHSTQEIVKLSLQLAETEDEEHLRLWEKRKDLIIKLQIHTRKLAACHFAMESEAEKDID